MSIRLIVKSPFSRFSGGSRGSRSEVQDFRICTDSAGSTRVHSAQFAAGNGAAAAYAVNYAVTLERVVDGSL